MVVVRLSWSNWNEEVLRSQAPTLVYFWHEECPWCRRLTPIFKKLASEYEGEAKFAMINVLDSEENRELVMDLGVTGTPTSMFFCEGRPLMSYVGFVAEEELRRIINDALNKYKSRLIQSTDLKKYIV